VFRDVQQQEKDLATPSLAAVPLGAGEKLRVVATTNIVGDVVEEIGGGQVEISVLLPLGVDPHSFEPTPQDVAVVSEADVVFANGAGLEQFLEPLLDSAGAADKVIFLSSGVELFYAEDEGESDKSQGGDDVHEADPHTWTDPGNVAVWVRNITQTLNALDPERAAIYQSNAETYTTTLDELDTWIAEQIAQIPQIDRRIVTDHATFGYFARRYGFQMVGTVIPGHSTLSKTSALELAELEDAIRDLGVKAIFVGNTVNPSVAQRVAEDTGVRLVYLYSGSLSEASGPAGSYVEMMKFNVTQLVDALR
jgi:ABC-type Zn uptake system ZnuABC Zn-binding protein ZnuA